jgi:2-iminobutanoate/2-iminopropanoate deaminase
MPLIPLFSPDAPQPIGPYSQAITAAGFIFTSGQIALDPRTNRLVEGGIEEETRQVIENLRRVLAAGDTAFTDVVSTHVYVTDLAGVKSVNAIYEKAMGEARPTRTTVQVAALPMGARIEIAMIAWKGGQ